LSDLPPHSPGEDKTPAESETVDVFGSNVFSAPGTPAPQGMDSVFDEPGSAREAGQSEVFQPFDEVVEGAFSPFMGIGFLGEEGERILEEARQRANAIHENAHRFAEETRRRAAEMLEEARRQVEEVEARAYQAGFAQGEEAGRRLGEQKVESVLKSLRSVIERMVAQRDALFKASEQELVRLAYLISLKVIHREIQQEPNVVLDMVRAALAKTHQASQITIQVSPTDFRFLEGQSELVRDLAGNRANVQIEPSSEVGRGGCRILSEAGEVDARVESMLDVFRKRIWEEES